MTDYYKILSDPEHAWLNDTGSPFRCWQSRKYPFIHFEYRRHKRVSYGPSPQALKYPVAERPYLYIPGGKTRQVFGAPSSITQAKYRFNYQMERLIKAWHREAKKLDCDHSKPFVRMADDLLADLFPLTH